MIENMQYLEQLLRKGEAAVDPAVLQLPPPATLNDNFDFGRVEAMLLGLAIGDALGNTTESQMPHQRRKQYGEITGYLENRYAGGKHVGLPSDDTQLAFWTLEEQIVCGGLIPDRLATHFSSHQIFGIGRTVRQFIRDYKDNFKPWSKAGQSSAGNGALMRIAPVLIPHLLQPSQNLWADAVLGSMVTHNDPASNACCTAFTHLLWECLRLEETPEPLWWVDTFTEFASQLEGPTSYVSRSPHTPYEGPLWKYVDREVRKALAEDLPVLEACERWYSGAFLLETMTCVIYILARHGKSFEEAVVRAVNDTHDNDTIAAITGAAVGALHGRSAIPHIWIEGLLGRTGESDDWHIFELIEDARQTFWKPDPQPTNTAVQALVKFLPVFKSQKFRAGEWYGEEGQFPFFKYDSDVMRFLRVLYEYDWMIPFNWPDWIEGKQLIENRDLVKKANLQTLRKVLTLHARRERFVEGHLANMLERGHITDILQRLSELPPSKVNRVIYFYNLYEPYAEFSNFYYRPIMVDGKEWRTSEHYYQAQKYAGTEYEEIIRQAPTTRQAWKLGRRHSLPLRPDWIAVKDDSMRAAVRAKFTQHEDLKKMLLETGDALLVEHTKNDSYWGDGGDGSGKNMLGKILMEIREELRNAEN